MSIKPLHEVAALAVQASACENARPLSDKRNRPQSDILGHNRTRPAAITNPHAAQPGAPQRDIAQPGATARTIGAPSVAHPGNERNQHKNKGLQPTNPAQTPPGATENENVALTTPDATSVSFTPLPPHTAQSHPP